MIALNDLNNAYIDLYTNLRNYIWSLSTVELLAELEVSVYDRFPDIDKVKQNFSRFKCSVTTSEVYREDEDLQKSMENFEELINNADEIYSPLFSLTLVYDEDEQPLIDVTKEEYTDGDQDYEGEEKEERNSLNSERGKKLFNIEHISKSTVD